MKGNKVIEKKVYKFKKLKLYEETTIIKKKTKRKGKEKKKKKKTRNRTRDFLHALSLRYVKHIANTLIVFY